MDSPNRIVPTKSNLTEARRMPSVPASCVPEHIIIVYDSCEDYVQTPFKSHGSEITPNDMLKVGLKQFIQLHHYLDSKSTYALIVLKENCAVWKKNFTNDVWTILKELEDIKTVKCEDKIELSQFFEVIQDNVDICDYTNMNVPPRFVVRTIFTYGRSITMPVLERTATVESIVNSPVFFFDVLMTHEEPGPLNKCQEVFNELQKVDTKGLAHFYAVGRSSEKLCNSFALLLGHPLQRAPQSLALGEGSSMQV